MTTISTIFVTAALSVAAFAFGRWLRGGAPALREQALIIAVVGLVAAITGVVIPVVLPGLGGAAALALLSATVAALLAYRHRSETTSLRSVFVVLSGAFVCLGVAALALALSAR